MTFIQWYSSRWTNLGASLCMLIGYSTNAPVWFQALYMIIMALNFICFLVKKE